MLRRIRPSLAATVVMLCLAGPVAAHHSTSSYDFTKSVALHGTVKRFQWTNPHSWLELVADGTSPAQAVWTLEAGTPNVNKRMGWTGNDLSPGDKVEVVVHPKRDGSTGGTLVSVTLPNGKVLKAPASIFGNKPE